MKNFYTTGETAKKIGVSKQTLRRYHVLGILVPEMTSPTGHRMYSAEQIESYLMAHKSKAKND